MPDVPSTSTLEGTTASRFSWFSGRAAALLSDTSVQHKTVRFGSLDTAHLALVKKFAKPAVVVAALFLCTRLFRQASGPEYYALGLVAFLISAQMLSPLDLRRRAATARTGILVPRLLVEWTGVAAVLVFLSVSFKLTHIFSVELLRGWYWLTAVALLATHRLGLWFAGRTASQRSLAQSYIIIGANEVGLELARRVEQSHGVGKFQGFFDYRSAERLGDVGGKGLTCNCTARDFGDFVRSNAITRVYIALPISTTPRIAELLGELRNTTASVYFVPNIFAFDLVQARCVEINGMPVFSICDSPLQGYSSLGKRAVDLTLALTALMFLWPIYLAVAIAIKRSSPGPVFFKQRRYGLNGEEILVYKFRSMTVCEDGNVITQASKRDGRITPIGAFLRRTSLDELPQILNVLEGKMSFVGPRPHAVAHNEEYRKVISGYMIRHKVRPGITGWAQVNGLRGETSTVDKMHQRVEYDLDYLRNWSLWLDVKIIVRTALTVLHDVNAY
jgi:putative colanic acid biosysnthesis UDP-glucose lipid carrier transferase